jgi:hypothetical protein
MSDAILIGVRPSAARNVLVRSSALGARLYNPTYTVGVGYNNIEKTTTKIF